MVRILSSDFDGFFVTLGNAFSASANPLSSKKDRKPSESDLEVSNDLASSRDKTDPICSGYTESDGLGENGRINWFGTRLRAFWGTTFRAADLFGVP